MTNIQKQQQRKKDVESIRGSLALERLTPSPRAIELSERYINGEISIANAIKIYKQELHERQILS